MEINIVNTINGHQGEPWRQGCKSLEVAGVGMDLVISVQLVQRPSVNTLNQRRNQMIARVSIHLHTTT